MTRRSPLWRYAAPHAADALDLVAGHPPDRLGAPEEGGLYWSTDGERFLLETPAGLRFLCEADGRRVIYDAAGCGPRDVAAFAFGALAGALAYQRGLLPLHASAVESGGTAVAFCAASGMGKSTLAAGLGARGFSLFCDDVLWVDPNGAPPVVRSLNRRLKLDALAARLTAIEAGEPVRSVAAGQADARCYAAPDAVPISSARTLPLSRIYVLAERDRKPGAPHVRIEPLTGVAALAAVRRNVFRRVWGEALRGAAGINQAAAAIAARVEVHTFARTGAAARFDETVEAIAAHLHEPVR